MSYTINRWNGAVQATVQDGTVDQSLDVKLVGKNYAGYGEIQNETFVHLLENFSGDIEPPKAISGQLWYDSTDRKLKVYTGDTTGTSKVWKTLNGAEYGLTEPSSSVPGDLWVDTTKNQLKVRIDQDWLVVGPQNAGTDTTQMVSKSVLGIAGSTSITHGIIAATVDGVINFIISENEFILDLADPSSVIPGFNGTLSKKIRKGITFPSTDDNGVSETGYFMHGTSRNTQLFDGKPSSQYLRPSAGTLNLPYIVNVTVKEGLTIGASNDLAIFVDDAAGGAGAGQPVIAARLGSQNITFSVKNNAATPIYPLVIDRTGIRPFDTGSKFNIGSLDNRWANVYATNFVGTADNARALQVGVAFRSASVNGENSQDTIVVRRRFGTLLGDNSSEIYATEFRGNAATATKLATSITINGVSFDGTAGINGLQIYDASKLPLSGGTLGPLVTNLDTGFLVPTGVPDTTGMLTLYADPTANLHAATKQYVDSKFGGDIEGVLGIAQGGTNSNTAAGARTNLNVPRVDGVGATINSTWNINIAPSLAPIIVNSLQASVNARSTSATTTTIVVQNTLTTGSNVPTGPGYSDITSVTPVTVAVGSKTWTVNKVSGYQLNTRIKVTYIDNPAITMQGVVTSVDNIALTITVLVDTLQGSGTNLNKWSFAGLGDSWRAGATLTGTAITGTVVITNVAGNTPAIGSTTLTVSFSQQTVAAQVADITATDQGDLLGGNAATSTRTKNIMGGLVGQVPYQENTDITKFVEPGNAGEILAFNGTIPFWQDLSNISVGASTQISVTNRPIEDVLYYPLFTTGGIVSPGGEDRSVSIDQTTLTYRTDTNTLTVGVPGNPGTGTIVASIWSGNTIKSSNGAGIVLSTGNATGADAFFNGKSSSADKLSVARTFTLSGILKGSQTFDGLGNCVITASYADDYSVTAGSITGNIVTELAAGTYITLNQGAGAYDPATKSAVTINVNAASTGTSNIVARDASGNFTGYEITATLFRGKATSANYADLAEKYLADAEYEPGTVVCVGGEKEVTASTFGKRALGVVSTQPAYMMNSELEGGTYIALKGRVPCKVIGPVNKGDELVAGPNGYATVLVSSITHGAKVFGLALESNSNPDVKVVEVAVL